MASLATSDIAVPIEVANDIWAKTMQTSVLARLSGQQPQKFGESKIMLTLPHKRQVESAEIKETRSGIADTYLNVGQKPDTRTVSCADGGGSGAMEPVVVEFGSTYTLPACEFTAPSGKEFG